MVDTARKESAATLVESWNVKKFWMFEKIPFPTNRQYHQRERRAGRELVGAQGVFGGGVTLFNRTKN